MNIYKILTGVFAVGAVVGLVYASDCREQTKRVCEKVSKKIDEISDDFEVDIPDSVVTKAVEKAVNNQVGLRVQSKIDILEHDIKQEIQQRLETAVKDNLELIEKNMASRIDAEISRNDMAELKRQVKRDATIKLSQKLDSDLNDILERYNSNLDNITEIYSSIANKLSGGGTNKEFKISLV